MTKLNPGDLVQFPRHDQDFYQYEADVDLATADLLNVWLNRHPRLWVSFDDIPVVFVTQSVTSVGLLVAVLHPDHGMLLSRVGTEECHHPKPALIMVGGNTHEPR